MSDFVTILVNNKTNNNFSRFSTFSGNVVLVFVLLCIQPH